MLTKFNSETFPKSCFKALYKRSNDWLFSQSTSAERERDRERERERERESKNEMRKQFGLSADENYQ